MFLKEHLNLTKSEVSKRKREEYRKEKVEDGAKREKSPSGPSIQLHIMTIRAAHQSLRMLGF